MRIILRKSGIYDVYNQDGGWLFSRTAADNVFAELARMPDIPIEFVDETAEKGTYRTVQELTREELNELKQSYVAETVKNPSWGELADSVDIPDEVIFEKYAGIAFGPEDFFCNMGKED